MRKRIFADPWRAMRARFIFSINEYQNLVKLTKSRGFKEEAHKLKDGIYIVKYVKTNEKKVMDN